MSAREPLKELRTAEQQARPQPPSIGQWTQRTPDSVTVGGLIDVYDTHQ